MQLKLDKTSSADVSLSSLNHFHVPAKSVSAGSLSLSLLLKLNRTSCTDVSLSTLNHFHMPGSQCAQALSLSLSLSLPLSHTHTHAHVFIKDMGC